jgi:glyoxylase-like metal-dependent hydrolase (beta-lactamase superfamily II)
MSYERGVTEVADGVFAYLQPAGQWGYSNAGLVGGEGTSLLVDTLFDLRLTRQMLDDLAPHVEGRPIGAVVNTHANGDHTYGNQLLGDVRIIASEASAREMDEVPPAALHALKELDLGEDGNRFVAEAFGPFRFDDITLAPANETFASTKEIDLGTHAVALEVVGPAHTAGDVIAHVADAGVVFTGDILFNGGTPVIWAGPVANWSAACRRVRALEPTVVVPGHGPLTDADGMLALEGYLDWLVAEVGSRAATGMSALDIAWDLDPGPYRDWSDSERLVINVDAALADLDPTHRRMDIVTAMAEMGRYRYRRW